MQTLWGLVNVFGLEMCPHLMGALMSSYGSLRLISGKSGVPLYLKAHILNCSLWCGHQVWKAIFHHLTLYSLALYSLALYY